MSAVEALPDAGPPVYTEHKVADPHAKALLKWSGLTPDHVATTNPGWVVTLADVQAEVARRGLTATVPAMLPTPSRADATLYVDALWEHDFHLMRLKPGLKAPVDQGWPDQPALDRDDAVAWLMKGGNLGINLGASGFIVLDAEDAAATAFLRSLGFIPSAITANAQAPGAKAGGAHFYLRVPHGVNARELQSRLQVTLPGGGVADFLAGARFAVAPGSQLIEAPGVRYELADAGLLIDSELDVEAPAGLWDTAAAVPAPVLAGILQPKVKREYQPNPAADAVTAQIDSVPWDDWLAGDPRVQLMGSDHSCGCDVFHWHASTDPRSGILHDGCKIGFGVHVFSGTMLAEIGRDHMSRLDFASWLAGRAGDLAEFAAEHGVALGGERELGIAIPEGFEYRERPVEPAPSAPAPGPASVERPEVDDTDSDAAMTVTAEELAKVRRLRAEIAVRERRLALMTPGLGRADHWAKCTGVYLHGLVTALICHSITLVPPNVVLPSRQGLTFSKAMGVSVNAFGLLCGPSAAGKTVTMGVANAAIPIVGLGIMTIGDGTAEGICRKARNAEKKTVEITATGILVAADEFDTVAEEMSRNGSKYDGFTRKVWMGVEAGSTASDKKRDAQLPAHSTRVCMLYGAQPASLAPLLGQAGRGTPQRYDFGLAGVMHSSEQDELYSRIPAQPILLNQGRLPWFTPTGLPPGYQPPDADAEDSEAEGMVGLPGYDHAEAIWVGVPAVVQQIIDAEGDRAAQRAADWDLARREDAAGISGHNVLLQERLAFAIATWDGEHNIAMEHWNAAGLLLEMRQLVFEASEIEARIADGNAKTQEGAGRGIVNAGAKASEAATTARRLQSACDRILDLVDAAAGVKGKASARKKVAKNNPRLLAPGGGLDTAYLDASLSGPQRGYRGTAVAQLRSQGLITGDGVIRRATVAAAQHVAPVIGTIGSPAA